MNLTFTQDDARIVFGLIASFVVPFIVSGFKRWQWPTVAKFALAVGVSLAAGGISEYLAGAFTFGPESSPRSAIVVAAAIFTASQAHYASWFRALGLDNWLNPEQVYIDNSKPELGD